MKLARTAIAYCGLLASVFLSHSLGNGDFISAPSLGVFSILVIVALSISLPQELEGPYLAMLALIAQTLGHFILGGGSTGSLMTISHIAGGIAGYQLVSRFDQLICTLENLVRNILVPVIIHIHSFSKSTQTLLMTEHIERVKAFLLTASYSLRAPPLYIVN
jgi:hypothetical protein